MIFIHELGHFLAAKYYRMPVERFSIGFGPAILKKKFGMTEYRLGVIPFGGYVSIVDSSNKEKMVTLFDYPAGQRIVVLLAGATFNFIASILTVFILTASMGVPVVFNTIEDIHKDSNFKGQLEAGDVIYSINNNKSAYRLSFSSLGENEYQKAMEMMRSEKSSVIDLEILRNGEFMKLKGDKVMREEGASIGVTISSNIVFVKSSEYNGDFKVNSFTEPFIVFKDMVRTIFETLGKIVNGEIELKEMSGPVGIVKISGDIAELNIYLYVMMFGILNINLGVMNLLPIPSLDGGNVVAAVLEKIFGKERVTMKRVAIVNGLFMLVIFGFILYLTFHDVIKIKDGVI